MERKQIEIYKIKFDEIIQELDGVEFWYARELQKLLGYEQWRNFELIIHKAQISCESAGINASDHFAEVSKLVPIGSGAERAVKDYMLTRYACYLIAQNGNPKKEEIAFAQSYFAVQTRKQELIEERITYFERSEARGRLRESEKRLSQNIYERGVDDAGFGRIRSKGDAALFGGNTTQQMKADRFEHVQNNSSVRSMLGERGIKPEELPPAEDMKKLERRAKAVEKRL